MRIDEEKLTMRILFPRTFDERATIRWQAVTRDNDNVARLLDYCARVTFQFQAVRSVLYQLLHVEFYIIVYEPLSMQLLG